MTEQEQKNEQLYQEALQVQMTLQTPGWRVIEELLDASLIAVQDSALDRDSTDLNAAAAALLEARGARTFARAFKNALQVACSVEKPEPPEAGLASQGEDNE
jgi:hypothetical protein